MCLLCEGAIERAVDCREEAVEEEKWGVIPVGCSPVVAVAVRGGSRRVGRGSGKSENYISMLRWRVRCRTRGDQVGRNWCPVNQDAFSSRDEFIFEKWPRFASCACPGTRPTAAHKKK